MIDPITIEVIKYALVYGSEEMGIAVRNSAYSPNIKERLDHSCALFDSKGQLIAQAEHIPVHLGSLPWGLDNMLRQIEKDYGALKEGQMWVANDPYLTGTHLNDVTVLRPIFFNKKLIGYAANKAHHTDVGGMVPGSISIAAQDLFAEGLIMPPFLLMEHNTIKSETVALFSANSRVPNARAGDLRAQIAGNTIGERRLLELYQRYTAPVMEEALRSILDDSEQLLRAALLKFPNGTFKQVDYLEDKEGKPSICIAVTLNIQDGQVHLDYTGTSPELPYAMNLLLKAAEMDVIRVVMV